MGLYDISKLYLIFGGTGSLGKVLVERILKDKKGFVFVFSRSEEKHVKIRQQFPQIRTIIGDVRDYDAVFKAIIDVDPTHIINAAALKNVPECEEFPLEAIKTNLLGSQNIVKAVENCIHYSDLKVLSISTDKACLPLNSYGMTKALQERIHLRGKRGIFNVCRYGNVLESRGSVIPFFKEKIEKNENLPVTHQDMTRFFMSLNQSVDLIFKALGDEEGGKVFIPKIKGARIIDLAEIMIEESKKNLSIEIVGIRPGEKFDECLVSESECLRTEEVGDTLIIHDILKPYKKYECNFLKGYRDYSSNGPSMLKEELRTFLKTNGVI